MFCFYQYLFGHDLKWLEGGMGMGERGGGRWCIASMDWVAARGELDGMGWDRMGCIQVVQ